jgi:hypothetical protein
MDEAEARAAIVMCYKCYNTGLTYKRCAYSFKLCLQCTKYVQYGCIITFRTLPNPNRS